MPERVAKALVLLLLAGPARAGVLDAVEYRYLLKLQASATQQEPADSSLNPGNDVLQLPEWNFNSQARLDFNASYGPAAFFIKPRFVAEELRWEEGEKDGDSESDTDAYINEWQLQLSLADELIVSYGRENLQWGPSYLFSPSNPFIEDNGQNNPKREVPGMDFAKAIWIPSREWSVSLIANTGEGEADISRSIDSEYNTFVSQVDAAAQEQLDFIDDQYQAGLAQIDELRGSAPGRRGPIARKLNAQADELETFAAEQRNLAVAEVERTKADVLRRASVEREVYNRDFQRQYAVKTDYVTMEKYATVIASYEETDREEDVRRTKLGGYAAWTATDALLLYTEASASLRGEELYPVADPESPLELRLSPVRAEENDFKGGVLAGASYTLVSGQTLVLEYLYNGVGYNDREAEQYYELRENAAEAFESPEVELSTLGLITLAEAQDPGMRYIRQNYLLLQYQQFQVVGDLSFVLRCTLNLDDQSAQLIPILQYGLGDRWQVFAIMSQNFGGKDTEFTSVYDHAYQLGLEASF